MSRSTSRHPWPWASEPRDPPIAACGNRDEAARLLGVTTGRLDQIGNLLTSGLPVSPAAQVRWRVDDDGAHLELDSAEVAMAQTFGLDDAGSLMVEFKLLVLSADLRDRRLIRTALKNAAIAYDDLGVEYCSTYANFDVGGYAWAKLGAMPAHPSQCRADLLARLAQSPGYDAAQRHALETLIRTATDETLMFDVAAATDDLSTPLGKPLLMNYSWSAIWVMDHVEQRARVAGALS